MVVQERIDNAGLNAPILAALILCNAIAILDGFDLSAVAFIAPIMSDEWAIGPARLGTVFGSGFFGLAAGAVLLAPLADRFGRRIMIFCGTLVAATGMILSGYSLSVEQFIAARVITGLGVGILMPVLATYVTESSPTRFRNVCMGCLFASGAVGGIAGGFATAEYLDLLGWRGILRTGGYIGLVLAIASMWGLPESPAFLARSGWTDALSRTNKVLSRFRAERLEALPEHNVDAQKVRLATLLQREYRQTTINVWMTFALVTAFGYFTFSWTPKMLVTLGLPVQESIFNGTALAVGSAVGSIIIAGLSKWWSLRGLVLLFFGIGVAITVAIGVVTYHMQWQWLLVLNFGIGFTVSGAFASVYTIVASHYPPTLRATSLGSCVAVARICAVIGPVFAGFLFESGVSVPVSYWIFAALILLAMIFIARLQAHPAWLSE